MNLDEIIEERLRQDAKWGEQNHPDVCPVLMGRKGAATVERIAEDLEIPTSYRARFLCESAAKAKRLTWASILVEEVCEAVEQAALKDVKALREELVQSAAVCVAWIEAIDRRMK